MDIKSVTNDDIAQCVNDVYKSLPVRLQPDLRPNGTPEWTILAGFVLEYQQQLKCVSVGVGVKCLPATRLPIQGDVLHDCHAEILAKRGFIKWILNELSDQDKGIQSTYLHHTSNEHRFKDGVLVHLYISTLPCGDASMAYTADHQNEEDAAYYSAIPTLGLEEGAVARGRMNYMKLGSIRTKPGRADAASTSSLSCSDKIATYTFLGVQGGLLANIMQPVYIDSIVIGGVKDGHEKYVSECYRSLYLRLKKSTESVLPETDYRFHKPVIGFTDIPFYHAKEEVQARSKGVNAQPAMHCANYVAGDKPLETELVIGGLKNGNFKRRGDAPYWWKYRSRLCRLELMRHCLSLRSFEKYSDPHTNANPTYYDLKHTEAACTYHSLKAIIRTRPSAFSDWIVTDPKHAQFDKEGVSHIVT